MMKVLYVFIFLKFSVLVCAQSVSEKFDAFQNSFHLEKVYLNHDKPFYFLGDTIWFKLYFLDGKTHQFFDASPILHVDWIDEKGEIVKDYLLKVEEGTAFCEIPTSYSDQAGEYVIRAYTQYQRNFESDYIFQKKITVFGDSITYKKKIEEQEDLNFSLKYYPEGGELISGLKNKVAFKAQNATGENIEIEGVLKDESGNEITNFKSYNEGAGFFEFQPEQGENYIASIRYQGIEKTFKLPSSKKSGYLLKVNGSNKESIIVQLASNTKEGLAGASLIAQVRGQIVLEQSFEANNELQFKIGRDKIPSGVVHFTLFDHKDRPVCERLSFNKNPREAVDVSIELESEAVTLREKLKVKVLPNQEGKSIPSYFSVSVYHDDIIPRGNNDINIVNYLLLQSDLKGRLPNINQYFIADDVKSNFLLDLVMLTNGWRRYTWQEILESEPQAQEFGTEESISIIGQVNKRKKEDPVKADVFLSILSKDNFSNVNMTTEDDGIFYFQGFDFKDTTEILLQANIHDSKKKAKLKPGEMRRTGNDNVDINILELDPLIYDSTATLHNDILDQGTIKDIVTEYKEKKRIDYLYHPEWSIDLEEITIRGARKTQREEKLIKYEKEIKDRGMLFFPSSQKIFMDDLPGGGTIYTDIFQIVRGRAPGVQVKGSGNERYFLIRNTGNIIDGDIPATVMVNGFTVDGIGVATINPQQILAIDIIKGLSSTSVFGEQGAGGVISIITKNPEDYIQKKAKKEVKGSKSLVHPGIYNSKEYYSPNYDKKIIDHQQPDLRTTLYWEPNIKTGKRAKSLSFFTGDREGNYIIRVEGISETGLPFVKESKFEVLDN